MCDIHAISFGDPPTPCQWIMIFENSSTNKWQPKNANIGWRREVCSSKSGIIIHKYHGYLPRKLLDLQVLTISIIF